MANELKVDFFWKDDETQFLLLLANSSFVCYFSSSELLI